MPLCTRVPLFRLLVLLALRWRRVMLLHNRTGAESEMVSGRIDPSMQTLPFGCQLPSRARQTVIAHERNEIHSLAHNCSGAMVLTGSDDRTIKLWDTRNGNKLAALEGAVKGVMSVAFSDDGKHVVGASNDFALRIWSLSTSRVLYALNGHQNKIYCAGFSSDSRTIFSGGYDRLIKLWDVHRGVVTQSINCQSSCNDGAMTRDCSVLVSVHLDASVRLWDMRTGQLAHEISRVHKQPVTSVCLVPTNPNEIVTNSRDDSLHLLDIRTYTCVRTFQVASAAVLAAEPCHPCCCSPTAPCHPCAPSVPAFAVLFVLALSAGSVTRDCAVPTTSQCCNTRVVLYAI